MNHEQKADEVLREVLFENWMSVEQYNGFLDAAKKQTGYCAHYLASDIASEFKGNDYINGRINQMKGFKKNYFKL